MNTKWKKDQSGIEPNGGKCDKWSTLGLRNQVSNTFITTRKHPQTTIRGMYLLHQGGKAHKQDTRIGIS